MKYLLLFSFLNVFLFTSAQSIQVPQICHDDKGFLKCWSDGTDLVSFQRGVLIEYKRLDGSIFYSDFNKRLIIIEQSLDSPFKFDTTVFQLHANYLFVVRRDTSFLIKSTKDITLLGKYFEPIYEIYYGKSIDGLRYDFSKGSVTIRLQDFNKDWGWTLVFWNGPRSTLIDYNSSKKNRLERFSIQDTILKCGMWISTTFGSLKKVSLLRSAYVTEWMRADGQRVIGELKIENPYRILYNKQGKLKSGIKTQVCSCGFK